MIDIPVPQKYRWEGKWPKSQTSDGTPNGGDGYLNKSRYKTKLPAKFTEHREASRAGMRHLVVLASGRRVWRG